MSKTIEEKSEIVRNIAEEYFKKEELFCSEVVLKTINDLLPNPQPNKIIKLSSGFAAGVGATGCLCGSISGGVMSLGLVYGRCYGEKTNEKMLPKAAALHHYMKSTYNSTCCRVLTKDFKDNKSNRKNHCMKLTGEVAYYITKILLDDNIELNIK